MDHEMHISVLTFQIEPSTESNDHQVRIQIDAADWLRDEHLGVNPPNFFAQKSLTQGGRLRTCGC
jgi:hypothetical protein